MSLSVNKLDVVFFQRKDNNSAYEQVNISGSNAIFYTDEFGVLQASNIVDFLKTYTGVKQSTATVNFKPKYGDSVISTDSIKIGHPGQLSRYFGDPGSPYGYKIAETLTPTMDTLRGIGFGKTKDVGAIIDVSGSNAAYFTGSVVITGSLRVFGPIIGDITATNCISASYALTASYALNGGSGGIISGSAGVTGSSGIITGSFLSSNYCEPPDQNPIHLDFNNGNGPIEIVLENPGTYILTAMLPCQIPNTAFGGDNLNVYFYNSSSQTRIDESYRNITIDSTPTQTVYYHELVMSHLYTTTQSNEVVRIQLEGMSYPAWRINELGFTTWWAQVSVPFNGIFSNGGSSLTTGSTYQITASWSINSISSSYALSASWAPGGSGGDRIISPNTLTNVIANNSDVDINVNNVHIANFKDNLVKTDYERSGTFLVDGLISSSNENVGTPISYQWGSSLLGSYFMNWNSSTYVSEILRFFAGAFSASFPNPTPNTRIYGNITTNQNNAGSTVTINGRLPSGSTDINLQYLNEHGWVGVGGQIFNGYTFKNGSTFNTTYDSVVGGSTVVSSSIGAQSIGLGPLNGTNVNQFNVSSSIREKYCDNSSSILTYSYISQSLYSQSAVNASGAGLSLAKIPSANPAVIPSAYQDGKYNGITGSGLVWNNTGNNLSNISSSGKYEITSSIGISSGSSPYNYLTAPLVSYYYTPISDGTFSTNNITQMNVSTASLTAFSRSLSGAPYLTTGSTWRYTFTGSNAFNPLYNNGLISQIITGSHAATVVTSNPITASVSTVNGITTCTGSIFISSSLTGRSFGVVPVENDLICYNVTFVASGSGTNIIQTGTNTPGIPTTSSILNRAGTAADFGKQFIYFHNQGSFGQPVSSGSLAYYGRPQGYSVSTETGTSETFLDESQRMILNDSLLAFTGSYFTSSAILGINELQVKPSFLVSPSGSYRYWYPSGYGLNYKYYVRHFKRTSVVGTLTINPGVTLVNWTDSTASGIAACLLFESAKSGSYGNCRLYDINNLLGPIISNVTSSYQNPFSKQIDLYYNGAGSKASTTITIPIVNANGMYLDNTSGKDEFYLIIRYNGDSTPITNISVTP